MIAIAKDLHMGAQMYLIRLNSVRKHMLQGRFSNAEKLLNKYNETSGICILPREVDDAIRTSMFLAELNLTIGLQEGALHIIDETLSSLRSYIIRAMITVKRLTYGGDIGTLQALPLDCLDLISHEILASI